MTSRSASDHENNAGIAVSTPKGTISKGTGRIEISVSGKATAEEFWELLSSTSYITAIFLLQPRRSLLITLPAFFLANCSSAALNIALSSVSQTREGIHSACLTCYKSYFHEIHSNVSDIIDDI
jgi:hypothetical protein